jgi:hypothetical protein
MASMFGGKSVLCVPRLVPGFQIFFVVVVSAATLSIQRCHHGNTFGNSL